MPHSSPQELLDRAGDAESLQAIMKQGIGGVFLAIFVSIIAGIEAVVHVVVEPINALASSLARLTVATFGRPAEIIIAGIVQTAESFGGAFALGPATFVVSIASVLAGLYLVGQFLQEPETGNLVPGLPFDVPFVGQEEEGEDDGL